MRRNLEKQECIDLLEKQYIGHLAYISGSQPHIVPITYYYDAASHTLTSYSSEGHKLSAMRKNTAVGLAVDVISSVANWKSVLVQGTFQELTGIDAKHMLHKFAEGVKKVIHEQTGANPHFISEFSAKIDAEKSPVVFRIAIHELSGKIRASKSSKK